MFREGRLGTKHGLTPNLARPASLVAGGSRSTVTSARSAAETQRGHAPSLFRGGRHHHRHHVVVAAYVSAASVAASSTERTRTTRPWTAHEVHCILKYNFGTSSAAQKTLALAVSLTAAVATMFLTMGHRGGAGTTTRTGTAWEPEGRIGSAPKRKIQLLATHRDFLRRCGGLVHEVV